MKYYLAIDIGASSGRHILGHLENGKLVTEEIYRFPNGAEKRNGHLCWDLEALWGHILAGMKECRKLNRIPATVGIDTWGVDYVLLDAQDHILGDSVAYRDDRTEGMREALAEKITPEELYRRTGICYQPFNTVYQLMADFREHPEHKTQANSLLFVPCWLTYRLSGKKLNEYSFASTSGLLNCTDRDWDPVVLAAAGIPAAILGPKPVLPCTAVGELLPEIQAEVGYSCQVILPTTHDTGSAYLSVPAKDGNAAFLSSGTWSLLGTESDTPVNTEDARKAGFTNEGGVDGRIRFLQNIMGLWPLQCIRKEINNQYTFAEMAEMAAASKYPGVTRINDNRYLAPESMLDTVRQDLREQGAPEPENTADILRAVTVGLAVCYRDAIRTMENLAGHPFTSVNIVGGGSQNHTLNQLTADYTDLPVYTGPAEGTALGNLACQMIAIGDLKDRHQVRELIRNSTEMGYYCSNHPLSE